MRNYCRRTIVVEKATLHFDEETLLRALAQYGRALAHAVRIAAALRISQ